MKIMKKHGITLGLFRWNPNHFLSDIERAH